MDQPPQDEIVVPELVESAVRNSDEPYGVPRRFGIGTMLVVTAAYGALLAILRLAGWPPIAIVVVLVFISLVGLGQMVLFGSKRPREASIVTGAVLLPVIVLIWTGQASRHDPTSSICGLVCAFPLGGAAGYLAGGVVAGVFLVMDAVDHALTRALPPASDDESSSPPA